MKPCFFFHNPKAGGTSLRSALSRYFSPDEVCPTSDITPDVYRIHAKTPLPGYRLYMGHYGYDICRQVVRDHALITNFRHPAERIASLYKYFRYTVPDDETTRRDPTYYAVRQSRRVDFETFVLSRDPRITTYTSNHHFRQLANSGWSLGTSRSIDEVFDLIDDLTWFYMCEQPELSVRWARKALDAPDFDLPRENTSSAVAAPSAEVLQLSDRAYGYLMDINQSDVAIYSHAMLRFLRETMELCATPRHSAMNSNWQSAQTVSMSSASRA